MRNYRYFVLLLILMISYSCSSKKKVLYVQDLSSSYNTLLSEHIISSDDILNIRVSVENPETIQMFGSGVIQPSNNETRESLIFKGYQVDKNGFINYPNVGQILVSGLTVIELRDLLYKKITESGILTNPTIDVKILNLNYTILGEVNKPGKYFFDDNNLNILEAIGMAGDLTINGERSNVKLIRGIGQNKAVYNIDLTKSSFIKDETFYVLSGDIIIVNPNTNRVKNAGIIGNSGTLLSLLSFLLSSIIIINR